MTETLTNEELRGICSNNFDLAHYAIELGRYYIKSGKETSLGEILKEVKRHRNPNYVNELKAIDAMEEEGGEQSYEG